MQNLIHSDRLMVGLVVGGPATVRTRRREDIVAEALDWGPNGVAAVAPIVMAGEPEGSNRPADDVVRVL